MSKAILNWLLELHEDGELKRLAKIVGVNVSGFRTLNAPRTVLIQNLVNSNKSGPLIKELNKTFSEEPQRYFEKSIDELQDRALRSHDEIPSILITLLGSNDVSDHEMGDQLFQNFEEQGILQLYKDYNEEHKKQIERENLLEKKIQELEQKNQSDMKRIKNIEEKLERVTKNSDEELKKYKKEKEEALIEKRALAKDKQTLTQENRELIKQNEAYTRKVNEIEQAKSLLLENIAQLEMKIKELTDKTVELEAQTKIIENIPVQSPMDEEVTPKSRVALVGRSVARKLLGGSPKAQFVSETEAVMESVLSEYEKVLLASFDLPFATRKMIIAVAKDKVIVINDQSELKQCLKQEAL